MKINKKIFNNKILFLIMIAAVIFMGILGIIYGSVNLSFDNVCSVLSGKDTSSKNAIIIYTVRLPRVLGGILVGAAFGTAGVLLQGVMNNSLASPNTIGVNSGAGFFVMLSMLLFPHNLVAKSFMAFAGAFITSVLILFLAFIAEKSRITIVLAGITISSFLSAGMNLIKIIDTDISINITQFLIGSLSGITMKSLTGPAIGIVLGILIAVFCSKALNILSLGDGVAYSLGLRVNFYRFLFVIIASILAGLAVSFAGLIGFVGLIVPHICRFLVGYDNRVLIPASAILGALFVLVADLVSRTLFSPYELPVGIILSLLGGPFFLYLLMRKGGRRINA